MTAVVMIMDIPKKVAAIHDIAGFGRSSLTVVIPVMSIMGHQTCPVPTAVLSSITGFYKDYTLIDLTDKLPLYLEHWKKEKFKFDCVYSGFLGSEKQAEITESFILDAAAPLTVVDPVFADDGKLYECFEKTMVDAMQKLIKNADVITPNLTEAAFLLDKPGGSASEYAKRLGELTRGSVVITGVQNGEKSVSIIIYDKKEDNLLKIENPYIHSHYPGTGDLFTAVLTASMLSGKSLADSAAKAADFVFTAMKAAYESKIPVREGVPLELLVLRLLENHSLPYNEIR